MSILTKEEREQIRHKYQAESIADASVIRALLDTIDDMEHRLKAVEIEFHDACELSCEFESERDALKTDLHLWKKTASGLHAQVDWMAGMTGRIKSIAEANHDTRTIGGAHAALRKIAEMAGGGE